MTIGPISERFTFWSTWCGRIRFKTASRQSRTRMVSMVKNTRHVFLFVYSSMLIWFCRRYPCLFFFPATIMSRAFVLRALWVHKLIRYNRRTIPRYGQPVPSQLLLCSFLLHAVRVATIFSCTPDSFDSSNLCLSRLLTLSSPFSLRSSQNVHRQI